MTRYIFSVLRYIHDGVTSEFVNVGVALYSMDHPFLKAKCTAQYGRITRMFDRIDGERFKQLVRHLEDEVNDLGRRLWQRSFSFAEPDQTIEGILRRVLPPDDSAIQFAPPGFGVSSDLDTTLRELYERYVERYAGQSEIPSRSDDEVWRAFRDPLERRHLLPLLAPKRISSPDYEYDFRASWKNDIWHVFEPISFDLVEAASVLDKANRWWGRSANLLESDERFRLHLLIGIPKNEQLMPTFEKAISILRKMNGDPELVLESDAEGFAADLEHQITSHQHNAQSMLDLT